MQIIDQAAYDEWKSNQRDAYGQAIFAYAERWADAMEARIAQGESLEDCAKRTSREADTEGITGCMYGFAVVVLAKFWRHGEVLRRWHNLDTQIGREGEIANESTDAVLNPAMIRIASNKEGS